MSPRLHSVLIWTCSGGPGRWRERDQGPDQELGRGPGHQDRRESGEDHHRIPEGEVRRGDALVRRSPDPDPTPDPWA